MKVLLCLCACIAASSAGIIGYPVAPVTYHSNYVIGHPFAPIARPLGVAYAGFPLTLGPSYFSYNVVPNSVVFPGVPGVVHYLPVAPPAGKEKPGKKMPGDKKNGEDKGTKEETTEEPKKEEESGSSTGSDTEELAQ